MSSANSREVWSSVMHKIPPRRNRDASMPRRVKLTRPRRGSLFRRCLMRPRRWACPSQGGSLGPAACKFRPAQKHIPCPNYPPREMEVVHRSHQPEADRGFLRYKLSADMKENMARGLVARGAGKLLSDLLVQQPQSTSTNRNSLPNRARVAHENVTCPYCGMPYTPAAGALPPAPPFAPMRGYGGPCLRPPSGPPC